ncbi:MAG: hypothetical protein JSV42_06010 [Chloroflexota bacterium]|nr:MAG: hypothetical protein JSV42_06010 [Chloroflexota bacterium]
MTAQDPLHQVLGSWNGYPRVTCGANSLNSAMFQIQEIAADPLPFEWRAALPINTRMNVLRGELSGSARQPGPAYGLLFFYEVKLLFLVIGSCIPASGAVGLIRCQPAAAPESPEPVAA